MTATTPRGFASDDRAVVWDSVRRRVLLVTADDGSASNIGLWSYDGVDWRRLTFAGSPTLGGSVAAAFDSARGELVLFSGHALWSWGGAAFQQIPQPPGLTALFAPVMAYDALRREVVLAGGRLPTSGVPIYNPTTWTWNGAAWRGFASGLGREETALTYDVTRGRVTCYGGSVYSSGLIYYPAETRVWTGSAWIDDLSLGSASGRSLPSLASDPGRGTVHLVGGNFVGAGIQHWILSHQDGARFASFGAGCAGGLGIPEVDLADGQMPWLGQTMVLSLSKLPRNVAVMALGTSSTRWGAVALPLQLGAFGMPTCTLLVSVDATSPVAGGAGRAVWSVPVPNAPWLVGVRLYAQAFVPDAAANAAGLVASPGVMLGLGNR